MATRPPRYRITVDLPELERAILTDLCEQDIRMPDEELRWLLIEEAKRRGIWPEYITAAPPQPQPTE
jgi:hypothetical protein